MMPEPKYKAWAYYNTYNQYEKAWAKMSIFRPTCDWCGIHIIAGDYFFKCKLGRGVVRFCKTCAPLRINNFDERVEMKPKGY